MDIGVSLRSGYPPMDVRAGARWMIERARAAAAAGLDSLFVGDHHNVPVPYYQNVAILGRLLAEWDDRPAGALFLLPLWHPLHVAEQIGTLASIARGRFIMQCAIGGGAEQFDALGVSLRERVTRFEASLDAIRRLCAGETVAIDQPWEIREARIAPIPPQPLEVWIGAAAPAGIDRAARLGDGFLIGPEATPHEVPELIARYRDACAQHGRAQGLIAIRRDVHVERTDDDAARIAEPIVQRGYRGFDPSAPVWGGIAKVTDAFAALGRAGCDAVIVRHLADDQADVLRSFEQLAEVRSGLSP
ncbi:MAG TPA: LLM class flavin-dependent oxidoreductase [Acidimicrobiia bacterium]|nr:LLM class flavin-dependent oxidoreductase [Acidimicrobiia bacterium]